MPQSFGDFLSKLVTKGGGNPADEKYKGFFGNADLVKYEVPDDLATAIDNGLISIKDAKNNHPDIKNHYTALALNGFDDKMKAVMDELELPEDVKNKLTVERSTYNRFPLLLKEIQALEQKKANVDKPDKQAIQRQIDDLHAELRQRDQKVKDAEKSADDRVKNFQIDMYKTELIMPYKTVYDSLPASAKKTAILALLNQKLQDNGAHLTFDENNNPVLLKKDGTNYYGDDNKQVNAQQFVEQVLSQNKLLQVTTPPPNQQNGSNNQQNGQPPVPPNGTNGNGGNNNNGSTLFKDLLKGSVNDFANSANALQ